MKNLLVLLLLLIACAPAVEYDFTPEEIAKWETQADNITIIRDNY